MSNSTTFTAWVENVNGEYRATAFYQSVTGIGRTAQEALEALNRTVSLLQRGNPVILKRVLATPPDDLGITAITIEKQMTGRMARLHQIKTNEDSDSGNCNP